MKDPQDIAGDASAEAAFADLAADVARHAELPGPPRPGPPPPPADLTAAAFFDVDNTLVQGSSLVHFGRGLAARKYFTYATSSDLSTRRPSFRYSAKRTATTSPPAGARRWPSSRADPPTS